jgi:predicted transcriptional regulator
VYLPNKEDLQRLMRAHGLKASDLSKFSGVSKGTISKIFNKPEFEPSYRIIKTLFEAVEEISTAESRPVEDLMTHRVVTVELTEPIGSAKVKMLANSISQIPVLSSGKVVGLITEKSILRNPEGGTVADALSYDYAVVGPDKSIAEIPGLIDQLQAIIVMRGAEIVGILTKSDFLKP